MERYDCYDCIHCGACSDAGDPGISCLKEDVSKCKHFAIKADFVKVVRCKDCKYSNDDGTICRYSVGIAVEPEHFCSYGEMREKEFDYGIVVYKHRFNMTRSLDDYKETTINKCIRIGLELKYKTMACDNLVYEMQIVYKDEDDKLQCLCLDLHDWTIAIKHIGNMQCNV